jgi:hypothetical protein
VRISVPAPALLSEPVPDTLAPSVEVSVKLATIWPSLAIAGVTIAPASPPMPRLRMLPAAIEVAPGELTTPPSAMVSVPTRPQPQLVSPIWSELNAFNTEPAPVTSTLEVPLIESPMVVNVVEVTVPPLDMTSAPGPPVLPPPTAKPKPNEPPTFQVEPVPVTVTVGVPGKRLKSISAPIWLLSTPPLLMVSVPGPKMPMPVNPATVTVEPAPSMIMLLATRRLPLGVGVVPTTRVPPLITARVPLSTVTPWETPLTVSEPPLIVSTAPPEQLPQRVRSPPIVPMLPPKLAPVSVSEAPLSSSSEPAPENWPENVVAVLPTILSRVDESVGPIVTLPPPASDPISTKAPSPAVRVEPALTVKAGSSPGLLMMPLLMVNAAPF